MGTSKTNYNVSERYKTIWLAPERTGSRKVSEILTFYDFKQNDTIIAAFGPTTANAVLKNNLRLDVHAPQPNAPSMTAAIEIFVKESIKKNKN